MDENEQRELRKTLLTYPNINEQNVDDYLRAYEERAVAKRGLVELRGMSNSQAEAFLDRQGYPRPPGWGSAIAYPGGSQLRWPIFILLLILAVVVGAFIF